MTEEKKGAPSRPSRPAGPKDRRPSGGAGSGRGSGRGGGKGDGRPQRPRRDEGSSDVAAFMAKKAPAPKLSEALAPEVLEALRKRGLIKE